MTSAQPLNSRIRTLDAINNLTGEELYNEIVQINHKIWAAYFLKEAGQPPENFTIDTEDVVLLFLGWPLRNLASLFVPYKDVAASFLHVLELMKYAIKNGTKDVNDVPGYAQMKKEIEDLQDESVRRGRTGHDPSFGSNGA